MIKSEEGGVLEDTFLPHYQLCRQQLSNKTSKKMMDGWMNFSGVNMQFPSIPTGGAPHQGLPTGDTWKEENKLFLWLVPWLCCVYLGGHAHVLYFVVVVVFFFAAEKCVCATRSR